jgi:hypothetical protein
VNNHPVSPQRVSNQVHPVIHVAAAALLIWFVVALGYCLVAPGILNSLSS